MKKLFLLLALSIFAFDSFCHSNPVEKMSKKSEISKITKTVKVITVKNTSIKLVSCTRTGTAQVSGVGCVDISVTAATCAEAEKGVADARKQMEQ
jgi:hypothetical protein